MLPTKVRMKFQRRTPSRFRTKDNEELFASIIFFRLSYRNRARIADHSVRVIVRFGRCTTDDTMKHLHKCLRNFGAGVKGHQPLC